MIWKEKKKLNHACHFSRQHLNLKLSQTIEFAEGSGSWFFVYRSLTLGLCPAR